MADPMTAYNKSLMGMCADIAAGKPAGEAFDKAREEYQRAMTPTASASHAALIQEIALVRGDLKLLRDIIADAVYENSSGKLHASMALSRIAKAAGEIRI